MIGSWPRRPGLAELANLTDLEAIAGGPLAGIMPENAGTLGRREFLTAALTGLGARLGGVAEHGLVRDPNHQAGAGLPACKPLPNSLKWRNIVATLVTARHS